MSTMDVSANLGTIYCGLPEQVTKDNQDVLALQKERRERKLTDFLKKEVPKKRIDQGLNDEIKYKVHYLDNVGFSKRKFDKSAKKKKTLTSREKRKLKLLKIEPEDQKYESYLPLHHLWKDYMQDLIKFDKLTATNKQEAEAKLLKADYHGAKITVTASKAPSLIGQSGIVVMETKNTFQIIRPDNLLRTLPKRSTNFTVELGGYVLTIYGNQMQVKACMRTVRKFKYKPTVDL